ncbi:hypothetical protein ThimaDRAFT_2253 [Thiocapsa marina 5811]|uniref:Uncharacterized protein n=1 Tax=Thiocapsa marina 5811 TaxID=768671 RepID=F9UBF1_9GAMM|nr:hypothetical protein ThimaDRAFT_2253 [Thiocapsa marina 5811]
MVSVRPACPAGAEHLPQPVRTDPLLWAALALAVLGLVMTTSVDVERGALRDPNISRAAPSLGCAALTPTDVNRSESGCVGPAGPEPSRP